MSTRIAPGARVADQEGRARDVDRLLARRAAPAPSASRAAAGGLLHRPRSGTARAPPIIGSTDDGRAGLAARQRLVQRLAARRGSALAHIFCARQADGSRLCPPRRSSPRACSTGRSASSRAPAPGSGRATALELAALGADRGRLRAPRRSRSPRPSPRSRAAGGKAEYEALDIRDEEAVDALFDGVLERHGRLDLLVNNAGGQFMSPAEAITPKGFRTVIELNVQGTWLMTHAAATKAFIPQDGGKVAQRHALAPQRDAGHGPLRRRPGRGREHDADALDRVGALRDQALRRRRRASSTPRRCRTKYPKVVVENVARIDPARAASASPRRWPG